jgi:WD40 repeat protein
MPTELQIFISSPGDVVPERRRAQLVIEALAKTYVRYFTIKPVLWEVEPMLASGHFQDQITPPSKTDILVLIVWSRLGTDLPPKTQIREYRGIDDRVPVTGTEWEFEDALAAQKLRGAPDLLAYRKQTDPTVSLKDKAARAAAEAQWDKLDGFWNRWFVNRGEFRAAFGEFADLDGFEAKLQSDLKSLIEGRINALQGTEHGRAGATWHEGSPFRGLDTYRFEHAPIFFGRSAMTKTAVEQFSGNADAGRAFLLIMGASGAGKSSLAHAGVIPALVGRGIVPGVGLWRRADMRPGGHPGGPFMALAQALVAKTALPELQASKQTIDQLADHLSASAADPGFTIVGMLNQIEDAARARGDVLTFETSRLVLLVDQLEELFTLTDITADERKRFVQCIDALAKCGRVFLLATMRSDHWHHAAEIPQLVNMAAGSGRIDLIPPVQDEIFEMIRQPAAAAGLDFEPDPSRDIKLDATLAAEAENEPGALPLLSFLLEELYKRDIDATGGRTLTYASMRVLGGLKGAIATRAAEVFAALPADAQAALPKVLRELVTVSRARTGATARFAPMAHFGPGTPERKLVDAFLDAKVRLLIADGGGDGARIRLAHEALITHWDMARRQIARDHDDLRTRTVIEEALAEQPRTYLRDPQLSAAVDLIKRWPDDLSADAIGFVRESHRLARLAWYLTVAAAVIFAVVAVAASAFWDMARRSRNEAQENLKSAQIAQSRFLSDLANKRVQDGDSGSAMLLALEALPDARATSSPTSSRPYESQAERALFQARQTLQEILVLRKDVAGIRPGAVRTASFSRDGKLIVTASDDRTARIWDAATGELKLVLLHERDVRSAAFNRDGSRVVTGSFDSKAALWDARTGRRVAELRGHAGPIRGVAFDEEGKRVVTASDDTTARVWDAEKGQKLLVLQGHEHVVRSAAFSLDGKRIVTASEDSTARLWDADSGRPTLVLKGHDKIVRSAAFSPDGKLVVTASDDKTARLWNAESGEVVQVLRGHTAPVLSAAFSPDGKRLMTASEDATIRLWDVASGQELSLLRGHAGPVSSAAFSRDGKLIVTAGTDQTARVWRLEAGQDLGVVGSQTGAVHSVAFSDDGKRLVTASDDKTARVWDVDSGRELRALRGHGGAVWSAAFSVDGRRIVTASEDTTAALWDTETGQQIRVLKGHGEAVRSASFSRDGKRVVTASDDATAKVWDSDSGQIILTLRGDGGAVRSAAFSWDGKRVVTASADQIAELWDAQSGQLIGTFRGHVGEVVSAEFSPGDRLVVTASPDDRTARLWDAASTKQIRIFTGHVGAVRTAAFNRDGSRVVTASDDKTARLWDVASGEQIAALPKQTDEIVSAVFSPDAKHVALASRNQALMWAVFPETQALVENAKAAAPRCLTAAQRKQAFLEPAPPPWCIENEKWPYYSKEWKDWLARRSANPNLPMPEIPD